MWFWQDGLQASQAKITHVQAALYFFKQLETACSRSLSGGCSSVSSRWSQSCPSLDRTPLGTTLPEFSANHAALSARSVHVTRRRLTTLQAARSSLLSLYLSCVIPPAMFPFHAKYCMTVDAIAKLKLARPAWRSARSSSWSDKVWDCLSWNSPVTSWDHTVQWFYVAKCWSKLSMSNGQVLGILRCHCRNLQVLRGFLLTLQIYRQCHARQQHSDQLHSPRLWTHVPAAQGDFPT